MVFHLTTGGVKRHKLSETTQKWIRTIVRTKLVREFIPQLVILGLLFEILPVTVFAGDTQTTNLLPYSVTQSTLNFEEQSAYPLTFDKPQPLTITIGESKADETTRLNRQKALTSRATKVTQAVDPDLSVKRQLVQAAAKAYNIPWQVLEAVWQVESGKSWDSSVHSGAGAQGPAQFMPSTWRRYGVDGDGDGRANIDSAVDAVYGAANYLAANGANQGQVETALLAYNHAGWYVTKVLRIAHELGYQA